MKSMKNKGMGKGMRPPPIGFARKRPHTAAVLAVLLLAVTAMGAFSLASETSEASHSYSQIDLNTTLKSQNFSPNWSSDTDGTILAIMNGTVNVTGTVANATKMLTLSISAGATVKWAATYSTSSTGINALSIEGNGKFEIISGEVSSASGHAINATNGGNLSITVTGGTVSSSQSTAIRSEVYNTIITVSGGTVSSGTGYAIDTSGSNANIRVTGGTVTSGGTGTIYAEGTASLIDVSGGTVSHTGNVGTAIDAKSTDAITNIKVSGGTVFNKNTANPAIRAANAGPHIGVTGGFVFSYGTGASSVVNGGGFTVPSGNGIVVAWSTPTGTGSFIEGSKTNLVSSSPFGAAAVAWHNNGTDSGISYKLDANEGFFPIAGVTVGPETFAVTVTGGTGGGSYAQGATVTITANPAPEGQLFKQWEISPAVTFTGGTSATDATAKFTMLNQAVTATAAYEPIPAGTYAVTVTGGTGGGSYAQGATVTITANPAPEGQQFKQWNISPTVTFTGGTSATDATAKFIMLNQAVTATAAYEPIPAGTYAVTVTGGTGGGSYAQGATVTITANPAPEGQQFKQWNISPTVTFTGGTSATDASAKFTMLNQAVNATAVYEDESAESGDEGRGSNTLLYAAIIVIVVLLVLAVVYFLFFKGKIGKP